MKFFFRIVTLLEGFSYVFLLFIASPIKHFTGNDAMVKVLGMPHGILFVAYIIMAVVMKSDYKWSSLTTLLILLASIVPFGTFWVHNKYLK